MDRALVLSLVEAYLLTETENIIHMKHYARSYYDKFDRVWRWSVVGGHRRRVPHARRTLRAIACVCKHEALRLPAAGDPRVRHMQPYLACTRAATHEPRVGIGAH